MYVEWSGKSQRDAFQLIHEEMNDSCTYVGEEPHIFEQKCALIKINLRLM